MWRAAVVAVLAIAASVFVPSPVDAQTAPDLTITDLSIDNRYPRELEFHFAGAASNPVERASLRYTVVAGTGGIERAEIAAPSTQFDLRAVVKTDSSGAFIPVGSVIRYQWEVEFSDGSAATTEEQEFVYLPPGMDWQSVGDESFVVYFHGDRSDLAGEYLEAVEETYQDIGRDLLQTELATTPVRLVLFADEAEMDPARPGETGSFEAQTLTCGIKFNAAVIFAIPQSCGTGDVTDTVRHEFAHILTETAGEGALGVLPAWLDEGTAVFAQSEPGGGYLQPFERAISRDELVPFNQMAIGPSTPGQVGIFYGQSYEMVQFLVDSGGPDAFARLFATIKGGERYDRAIEQVYGMSMARFENSFRSAHGLSPRTPTSIAGSEGSDSQTALPDDGDSDSRPVILAGLLAAAFLLLAVFFALLLVIMRRSRRPA